MKKTLALIVALVMLIGLMPQMTFRVNAEASLAAQNELEGKTISILGDGISTFSGVSNNTAYNAAIGENAVYYHAGTLGVYQNDTWWQQAIDALGLDLLVNNSWSGSCILHTSSSTAGAYADRCVQLHNTAGEEPDIIAVFMGSNDFIDYQSDLGTADIDYAALISDNGDGTFTYAAPTTSCEAYAIMLHKMTQRYEDAQIYCMTLPPRRDPDKEDSSADEGQPTAFNAELARIIEHFGCTVVDLENCGIDKDPAAFDQYMGDSWVHPNAEGMDLITQALVSSLLGQKTEIYDISAKLTNVTMEGKATVLSGGAYTASLTQASGFDGLKITVTMDGEDITDSCCSGGNISISSVTGDVVITASAQERDPEDFRWESDNTGQSVSNCTDYVNAAGHTAVIDGAIAPGRTEPGLTEGKHCSTCGMVLLAQQVIPAANEETSLPDGYVNVEYLDSMDGAYIDTGIAAEAKDKFILYASGLTNSTHSIMGSGSTNTANDRVQVHYVRNSGYTLRFFGEMSEVLNLSVNDKVSFILDMQNGVGYINGKIVLEQSAKVLPTDNTIYLFTKNINGKIDPSYTDDSRIYAYKHYRNGTLVRDMVPCYRQSDGEYGMYDLVGKKFYANAGNGFLYYDPLDLTGRGGIVMNMDTGEIIFRKNIHWEHAMASTTKIMTCVLALENLDLADRTKAAISSDLIGGSTMGLVKGESLTVLNALYGLILPSGNDAAQLLARTVAGDYDTFIKKMNDKAAELGMTNTHYSNTSGLDVDNHYSTVYDMATLMRYAMQNETFRMLVSTKTYQIKADGLGGRAHSLTNTNQLLGTYEGCIGGKTGTTPASGAHLIAVAERNGTTLVAVILGSDTENRYPDAIKLLDYGFEQVHVHSCTERITAPTCTEQGFTTYTCTTCGESYVDAYVDALGHDLGEWYTVEAATCTETGLKQRDCSRCDHFETGEAAATGHEYESVVTAPTCTEQGFTTYTCTTCGESFADTYTEALGHDHVGGVCTRCGDTLRTEIAGGYSGDLTWKLTDDGILTFSGTGAMKNYTYKSEMPWYGYFDQITGVVVEEGAASIGDYAFYGMDITSIAIPETVTYIGAYAFKNASKLDNVKLPSVLTKLGESAFYACTSLTSIEIPASLWTVQPYTFKNCTALQSVTFHEGNLQKISDGAFYATGLTEVHLPDCLDILDVYVFKNCVNLAQITLPSSLTQVRTAVLYGTAISEIEIPEGVTVIKPYAFKNCANLESVSLPSTLTSVDEAAFYACAKLASVDLPDAVTKIGSYAFRKCAGLTAVDFSADLVDIGESSFYGCTGLTALDIPEKVTTIQAYAFKGCTTVTSVALPDSLTTIGDSAFHTCTDIKTIVLPVNVETIGEYCFSNSWNLYQITFEGDAPAIGTGAFNRITATAYYPGDNATWTAEMMQNYGGTITWMAV